MGRVSEAFNSLSTTFSKENRNSKGGGSRADVNQHSSSEIETTWENAQSAKLQKRSRNLARAVGVSIDTAVQFCEVKKFGSTCVEK